MRRSALLGTMMLPTILLLSGCSGLGKFFGDTITLPGMNPNLPMGVTENADRARGQRPDTAPILPDAGNVWPGPPQPLPTLNEVSREQGASMSGLSGPMGQGNGGQAGPAMHDGGSMSLGESDSISNGVNADADSFSGGGGTLDRVPDASDAKETPDASARYRGKPASGKGDSIVIPNGDGTSTVIGPDGTVKTVKSAPK